MIFLNINGPINAGKTTVSKRLQKRLPNALFIEADNLVTEQERKDNALGFWEGIALSLERLDVALTAALQRTDIRFVIFAYPLSLKNYQRWQALVTSAAGIKYITLAPSQEACLKNRGTRALSPFEEARIKDMYAEGYHRPEHTDVCIDNTCQTPDETVDEIIGWLRKENIMPT